MAAIGWVRERAKPLPPGEILEAEGKKFQPTYVGFKGKLPYRMRCELARAKLIQTATEYETIRVLTTASGYQTGEVEYWKATYTEI